MHMQMFQNPNNLQHTTNCAAFETFMREWKWVKFFQPNPERAPWHVVCMLETEAGDTITVNFWPHKLQGQYKGPSVIGMAKLHDIMRQAVADREDACEVIDF